MTLQDLIKKYNIVQNRNFYYFDSTEGPLIMYQENNKYVMNVRVHIKVNLALMVIKSSPWCPRYINSDIFEESIKKLYKEWQDIKVAVKEYKQKEMINDMEKDFE
jgi:hypothetical protein